LIPKALKTYNDNWLQIYPTGDFGNKLCFVLFSFSSFRFRLLKNRKQTGAEISDLTICAFNNDNSVTRTAKSRNNFKFFSLT
jgi:hypothetical protein